LMKPVEEWVPTGTILVHQPPLACIRERATVGKPPFARFSRVARPTTSSDSPGQTEVVHHSGAALAQAATVDCRVLVFVSALAESAIGPFLASR
jgi:hypothetical protein